MANQHPMRAEPHDDAGTDRYGAAVVREAVRTSEREEAQKGHMQRSGTGSAIIVGMIAILIGILSVIALWLKS
jgi:hypothetical protein